MIERRSAPRRTMLRPISLTAIAALQAICGLFFVQNLVVSVLGLRAQPLSWSWRETLEIMATAGLILGMVLSALLIRALIHERRRTAEQLRAASGEFFAVVQDHFDRWGLTPSERDVALFMLKGLSNQEIAAVRKTSEGTIKAQSTAVFRKASVTGRGQLLSLFIEALLEARPAHESAGRAAGQAP